MNQWDYQWKMQFNPDPNKQANEVIFSWKSISHLILPLNLIKELLPNVIITNIYE